MVVGLWMVYPLMSHDVQVRPLLAARRPLLPLKPGGCQDMCVYVMLGWPYFGIAMGLFYVRAAVAAAVGRVAGRAKGD